MKYKLNSPLETDTTKYFGYTNTPFILGVTQVKTGKGTWDVTECNVYFHPTIDDEWELIGSFNYGYHGHIEDIFCPFIHHGKWYATYSTKYTALSIASLGKTFEHVWSDDGGSYGFCPVEAAVPKIIKRNIVDHGPYIDVYWDINLDEYGDRHLYELMDSPVCFYSGCVWGDDSSWKLQLLNISRLHEGVITKEHVVGHFELPDQPLRDCLHHFWVEDGMFQFAASRTHTFRLNTTTNEWKTF